MVPSTESLVPAKCGKWHGSSITVGLGLEVTLWVQGGALIGSTVNVKLLYIAVLKSTANFIQNDMWYVAVWAVYAGKVMQLLLSAI